MAFKWKRKLQRAKKLKEKGLALKEIAIKMKVSIGQVSYWFEKEEIDQLEQEAYALWYQKGIERWGNRCEIEGDPMSEGHHFVLKSENSLMRYDIMNFVPLCSSCHYKIHHANISVEDVREIADTIRKKRGEDWCDYIDSKRKVLRKKGTNAQWLEEQISKLKQL